MGKSRKEAVLQQLRQLRNDLAKQPKGNPEVEECLTIVQKEIREISDLTDEQFLPIYHRFYAHIATTALVLLFCLQGLAQVDTAFSLPQLPAMVRTELDYGLGRPFPFEVYRLTPCGELELLTTGLVRGISVSTPVREPGTYFVRLLHPQRPRTVRLDITPLDGCEAGHYVTVKTCEP